MGDDCSDWLRLCFLSRSTPLQSIHMDQYVRLQLHMGVSTRNCCPFPSVLPLYDKITENKLRINACIAAVMFKPVVTPSSDADFEITTEILFYRQSYDVSHPYKSKVTMGEDCPQHRDAQGLCGRLYLHHCLQRISCFNLVIFSPQPQTVHLNSYSRD